MTKRTSLYVIVIISAFSLMPADLAQAESHQQMT